MQCLHDNLLLPTRFNRHWACLALVFVLSSGLSAHGQTGVDPLDGMVAPADLYGNAQPIHPDRRPLDIFQNEVQRQALRGYQTYNRPLNQRGYGTGFALPSDQFMKTMAGRRPLGYTQPGSWQQRPSAFGLQERERKSAFSSYGGFSQRRSAFAPGDAEGAFARKRSLIAATGSTAPIERSKLNRGRLGSTRFPVAQTPSLDQQPFAAPSVDPTTGSTESPSSLGKFLTNETQVLHDRAVSEGWNEFQANDYRAAVRSFESAAMLDDNDSEARIAALFCYVSIGSFRSAYVALEILRRRDSNIFGHDLSMTARYGDASRAQQVRLTAQAMAESSEQGIEMKALAIFVLWYMDRRDDALRAAKSLVGREAKHSFANWPELMQAEISRPQTENP